jgi:hypothetical protein
MIYVSRQEHFNAAHKLHNPKWSDERNREVFGPAPTPIGTATTTTSS